MFRYPAGEEVCLGDVVENHSCRWLMVEFFIEPETQMALDFSAPNGGFMLLSPDGGRELYETTEYEEDLKLVHRFDDTVADEFEKHGQLCRPVYSDGTPLAVGDEIEYEDWQNIRWRAQVIAVYQPFTQSAWDAAAPTGGFRVRHDDGDIVMLGRMSPSVRLLGRSPK